MLNSPIPRIKFPKRGAQDQDAQPEKLPVQQPVEHVHRPEVSHRWEWHEAQVLSTLSAEKKRVRNRLLLVLAGIAGLTGLIVNSTKPENSAYEVRHGETEPGKKEGKRHQSKPSGAPGESVKSSSAETHRDIPHEFFVLAEKMVSKGNLASEYLDASEKARWTKEIVEQMSRANIPLNRQNIMIALATIDHESGFHETGILSAPEDILDREMKKFKEENPKAYGFIEGQVPKFRAQALKFINDRRAYNLAHTGKGIFTEMDGDLAIDYVMKSYEAEVPDAVKKIIPKEYLNRYRTKTCGSMQLNVKKAIALAKEVDRETYTDREMRELLYTRKGGLYYGMLYLKKIIDAHTTHYGEEMSAEEVQYVFTDYNMGVFTTRNAAIQSNIKALGKDIAVDGDLLSYDKEGQALKGSDTEKAIREVLRDGGEDISDLEINYHLSMEKMIDFEGTRTYRLLCKIFKQHGIATTNVIPSLKTSGSFVKFGTAEISGAGYAEGSYRRYETLRNAMKALTPEKPHVVLKAKQTKRKK